MIISKLKEIREKAGITQADLCRKTGIMQSQLSRYESGQIPEYETMLKIADAIGVRVQDLWPTEKVA